MNFFLKINLNIFNPVEMEFLHEGRDVNEFSENYLLIPKIHEKYLLRYYNEMFQIIIIGDLIIPDDYSTDEYLEKICATFNPEIIKTLKGHFYLIVIDKTHRSLYVFNSLFSILPVYIFQHNNSVILSSSIANIKQNLPYSLTINKKYFIERVLFNFSFLNDTIYHEIQLLPSNSYIKIRNKVKILKHLQIRDFFIDNPLPWQKALEPVSEIFLDNLKYYLPEDINYITLTGGFDGRTLVAYALKRNKIITTFSYGSSKDKDVILPRKLATELKFNYKTFLLENEYAEKHYIQSLENFIENTDGNGSYTRSHYDFIAKELSKETQCFLSGNFGSEIIRTMRIPGVMTSAFLFDIFNDITIEELYKKYLSIVKNYFNYTNLKIETETLFEEIVKYKSQKFSYMNANQKFYLYLFEEVFRKYFGPEIISQMHYSLINRTPYLDFNFIKELLRTELAGVNGRYKENNPLFRFRGQIIYAYIMKKLGSPLAHLSTDRGYKPIDLLNVAGKVNIARYYFWKKIFNRRNKNYTIYNDVCFRNNIEYFRRVNIDKDIFKSDSSTLSPDQQSIELSHIISICLYLENFA